MAAATKTRRRQEPGVAYSRYSRLGSRDQAKLRTLEAQADKWEEVADQYGIRVLDSFEDRGKSGGSLDREGLQSALAMIDNGEATVLVAAKLSRLARSTRGALEIIERVTAAGGRVILGDLGVIDTKSPAGKLLFTILAAFAEMELDLAREHGLDARTAAIEKGVAIMTQPPFGYNRPEVFLVPDDVRGPVMTEVFDRRAGGATWRELTDYIFEKTGDIITPQTLSRMISNPTYLGSVRSGELVKHQAHPALTDQTTWEAAQSTRRLNSPRKHRSLLAGLLTCSGCGNPMTFRLQQQKGKVERYPVYACQRNSVDGRCALPVQVSARLADEAVTASFLAWAAGTEAALDPRDLTELAEADQELAEAEAELTRYVALDLGSIIDAGAFRKGASERQDRIDLAREKLTALRKEARLETLQASVSSTWPQLDSEGRRKLIAAALDGVLVHRTPLRGRPAAFEERAVITWRDS